MDRMKDGSVLVAQLGEYVVTRVGDDVTVFRFCRREFSLPAPGLGAFVERPEHDLDAVVVRTGDFDIVYIVDGCTGRAFAVNLTAPEMSGWERCPVGVRDSCTAAKAVVGERKQEVEA